MLVCALSAHDIKRDCDVSVMSFFKDSMLGFVLAWCLTDRGGFYYTDLGNLIFSKDCVDFLVDKLCIR